MTLTVTPTPSRILALVGVSVSVLVLSATAAARPASANVRVASNHIAICERKGSNQLYLARKCNRHDRRIAWSLTGPQGTPGQNGASGPQGPAGQTGATGPQGPGALEYTYDTSAPAATEQNTPLGPAGPFDSLTGSCTVSGNIVMVVLGATNAKQVTYDETRSQVTNGGTEQTTFQTATQPASSSPADLIAEANTTNAGDGYNQTTLLVTSPAHGELDVFEHVSHANNTCHLSVVWTPAT